MTVTSAMVTQHLVVEGNVVNISTAYMPLYIVKRETGALQTPSGTVFFWAYGNKLTTMMSVDLYGGYVEWDVWRKTSDKVNQVHSDEAADPRETPMGGLIGSATN